MEVIQHWVKELAVRTEDVEQTLSEYLHILLNGKYVPDKGSIRDALEYYIGLVKRKNAKTQGQVLAGPTASPIPALGGRCGACGVAEASCCSQGRKFLQPLFNFSLAAVRASEPTIKTSDLLILG